MGSTLLGARGGGFRSRPGPPHVSHDLRKKFQSLKSTSKARRDLVALGNKGGFPRFFSGLVLKYGMNST